MAVKGEMKEESQEEMVKEVARRVAVGLEEQVKSLLMVSSLALIFVVTMLTNVSRSELVDSDESSCAGARDNKCNRSDSWSWGNISSFGPVYSYRLLSSAVLSIQFLLFALFLAVCLHLSLCMGKNREGGTQAGSIYYAVHDLALFLCHTSLYVGLIYFMFGVEAMVHVKFPSYKPSTFWNENTGSITQNFHNPPYQRFLEIFAWFTMSFAVATFLIFAVVGKTPVMMMASSSKKNNNNNMEHQDEVDEAAQA